MTEQDEMLTRAKKPAEDAMRLHPYYRGKVQMAPKCPVRGLDDFAVWYTPGVAAPCRAIHDDRDLVYEHTNKANTVAIASDGSRVLGLGDIGPEAGLPVMEGKALLFKYLGGIDAVPLCLRVADPDEMIQVVRALEPSFGGINLEDISHPKCFRILDTLRREMTIPVWHDDQQGTATVILAALINALKVVEKEIGQVRIALVGIGAANVSVYRLLVTAGVEPEAIVACDSEDINWDQAMFQDKWRICQETNADGLTGGIEQTLRGADVCIALSEPGPDVLHPAWIKQMARGAVVFACANPTPEIWPWEAKEAGDTIVATGRSDFANQVNNSLGFPGIFRGTLDVRARTITDEMALAAAHELAEFAQRRGIDAESIIPTMDEWEVFPRVAAATAMKAQDQGVAEVSRSHDVLYVEAKARIQAARDLTQSLMNEGLIAPVPESSQEGCAAS